MKLAKFITDPNLDPKAYNHPWKSDNRVFNNRSIDLEAGQGLLTFLKKFTPSSAVKTARLRITSLGIFEAYLNGKRIGENGVYDEMMPLWTDYRYRVFECEYDLLPYLRKTGENFFAARVSAGWWSGRISFGYYGFKSPALCAELELTYRNGTTEIIATDEDWKTTVAGPVMSADIWDGEFYDARVSDPCVTPDAVAWRQAKLFTDYTCEIVPFEGERVRVNEYVAPISATVWRDVKPNGTEHGAIKTLRRDVGNNCERMRLRAGQHLMLDFGVNLVGRPAIAVMAADGTKISGLFAEMLNDSGDPARGNDGPAGSIYIENYRSALSRMNYIARGVGNRKKKNIFRPLHTYYGFRYLELTADRDIEVECVTAEVMGAVMEGLGSFECSDAEVNRLYSNIEWGMKGNYFSAPTDCPQRDERLGWTGDTQIFCGAASYIANTERFLRRWLGDARDSQKTNHGAYGDVIPRVFESDGGNAAWADAGLVVPMKLYEMFGDPETVAENYDAMEAYMEYLSQFGLEGPNTAYGDWLAFEPTDKRYISVCYYAYDAALMVKFSELLGRDDRKEYYRELRQRIVAHYHERYVENGEITEKTQTAYLLALAFDLVEGELFEKTVKLLKQKIVDNDYTLSTGFVGTGILNQTLSKLGLDGLAYSLLLQTKDPSWLYSVRQGATTVWERWNSYTKATGFGKVTMNSFNHYAYGAVAEWLYATVAGIRPDPEEPGFAGRFVLAPTPDTRKESEIPAGQKRMTMASATYRGIHSRWEYENERFVCRFVIPCGVARVEFPLLYGQKTVEINNVVFNAKELGGEIRNGRMVFELTAGSYTVK
ncbi:MAG: hypothetical protein E7620_01450 [Ruminococcaceae bacterium]|nr:hypothetical protein [Oscillospiraceae bacterium]